MVVGASFSCSFRDLPIDPAKLRNELPKIPTVGGLCIFEGIVRSENHGKRVVRLDYEAYETLALKEMQRIGTEAKERFGLAYSVQCHRTGSLEIGDIAVFIAAMAKHRHESFLGSRYIIDQLKLRVPVWKKEYYDDRSHEWTRCHELHRRNDD